MRRAALAALLALAAAPLLAQPTIPATVPAEAPMETPAQIPAQIPVPPLSRWDSLARLAYRPSYKPRPVWVERARALGTAGTCTFKPDATGTVRLSVSFVVLLDPAGAVADAHADYGDCPALAALVETFARALGPTLLVPPDGDPPYWRASHFYAGWQE